MLVLNKNHLTTIYDSRHLKISSNNTKTKQQDLTYTTCCHGDEEAFRLSRFRYHDSYSNTAV